MTRDEVYAKICIYDERSPHYLGAFIAYGEDDELDNELIEAHQVNCWCENCWTGRNALAIEILRLMDEVDELNDHILELGESYDA